MNARRISGAGLVVALAMLVVMSVGAVSLVRAVSTGRMVAANLAFRQAAVLASDAGNEAAIDWLTPQVTTAVVYADQPEQGYYASVPDGLDATGSGSVTPASASGQRVTIDWDDDQCTGSTGTLCVRASPPLPADAAGNVIRYTIHRLCRSAGSPQSSANSCLVAGGGPGASNKRGTLSYGASSRFSVSAGIWYRITVRVRGPRNTTVFTQTLLHF